MLRLLQSILSNPGEQVGIGYKVKICSGLAIVGLAVSASFLVAQGRVSDKDLEAFMRNLSDDAKSFRPVFENAIKKSTIRKTSREKDAKALAERFAKQSEALLNRFKQTKKADSELSVVRDTARQIDDFVRTLNLNGQVASRWGRIQSELRQITGAFGIPPDEPRPNASNGDFSGPACVQAVGPERAKRLTDECLAVSPATRPPCNAQNSCPLIIDEIKRGCSMLEARNAPAFCAEYR